MLQQVTQAETERLRVLFDPDGYLADPEDWDRSLAERLARDEGIDQLGERHWRVINHVRSKYLTLGALPTPRVVCHALGMQKYEIKSLFGGCRPVWRIAGLPNPGEEAKSYMN